MIFYWITKRFFFPAVIRLKFMEKDAPRDDVKLFLQQNNSKTKIICFLTSNSDNIKFYYFKKIFYNCWVELMNFGWIKISYFLYFVVLQYTEYIEWNYLCLQKRRSFSAWFYFWKVFKGSVGWPKFVCEENVGGKMTTHLHFLIFFFFCRKGRTKRSSRVKTENLVLRLKI